jgi:hypothetical protein
MKKRFSRWDVPKVKRNEEIEKVLKNDPFLYHKKKYVISSRFNDGDTKEGDDTNNELLVFQDENKKHINTLKNKINKKSFIIEENANNYLNYMMNEKNFNNKNMKTEPGQRNKRYTQLIKSGIQSLSPNKYALNKNLLFSNYQNNTLDKKFNMNYPYNYKSIDNIHNMNKAFSYDENNFLPLINTKKSASDITDNNYYDKISRQLKIKFNKDYLDYNQEMINKRKSPSNANKMPYIKTNNELTLPIGGISNPNYYNLGESKLSSNPIVNPGNRAQIFNQFRTHKLKSEFTF